MTAGARGTQIPFVSACPTCGLEQAVWYAHSALIRLLQRGHPVEGYCVMCDVYWEINAHERDSLAARLTGGVFVCPSSNAMRLRKDERHHTAH